LPVDSLWRAADAVGGVEGAYAAYDAAGWRAWVHALQGTYQLDAGQLRVRNADGCPACRRPQLSQLNGTSGRSVAAEMIEPERLDGFLNRVRARDNAGLDKLVREAGFQSGTEPEAAGQDWRESATRGARALHCALLKVSTGEVDPRALLRRFDVPMGAPAAAVRQTPRGAS